MTTIALVYGVLTNEHAASSYGQPVMLYEGVAHGADDMVDLGVFGFERAYDHGLRSAGGLLDADQVAMMGKWIAAGKRAA